MTRKEFGLAFALLGLSGAAKAHDDPPVSAPPAPTPTPEKKQDVPPSVKEIWDAVETWTLYSLAPEQKVPAEGAARGKTKKRTTKKTTKKRDAEAPFHGFVVLGKAALKKDAEGVSGLKDALYAAIEKSGLPARCFIPHHGIRAVSGEKTLDLVICFTCSYMDIYVGGERLGERLVIAKDPFPAFDKALATAEVPLGKR
jgi:hypothetical protein